jgi:hypothetical protein|tara:strand:- start:4966 stop:6198 length:1233 start_codon:yes stop_codon:yes gene_type:complete
MEPLLTVQIPTYKNLQQLEDTVLSLLMHTEFPLKVVIINNDPPSQPHIEELVESFDVPNVEIIDAGGNTGWMGAHNLALKSCNTPYVALLNDDVVFLPYHLDFWRKLCAPFRHANVGAVGPTSNFVMGSQSLWNIRAPYIYETTLLIGFCVVMRTELIKEIGGLDELLPGGDDFDWSIRIRKAGYRLIVDRSAYLHHLGQQTGRRVHGNKWDGTVHQEDTVNAIIHKHGIRAWYETVQATMIVVQPEGGRTEEDLWLDRLSESVEGSKGINLGCGDREDIAGVPVDMAKPGDRGAGGRKFTGAKPHLVGDAMNIPVADHSQDYIFAIHLFEHLIDPVAALEEWKRVLKPEGMVYAVLPEHGQLDTMVIDYSHVHAYTAPTLTSLMESQGFVVEGAQSFNSGAFGVIARVE